MSPSIQDLQHPEGPGCEEASPPDRHDSPQSRLRGSSIDARRATALAPLQKLIDPKLAHAEIKGWLVSDESYASGMQLVWDTRFLLRAIGLYEYALLAAIPFGWRHPRAYRGEMFDFADPTALRLAGDPLTPIERFTVYRGVGGVGRERLVRGYSWTLDKDVAQMFAQFYGGPHPRVYEAVVEERHVLTFLYWGGRLRLNGVTIAEREIIVHPRHLLHVQRIPYMPLLPLHTPLFNGDCECGCDEPELDEADYGSYK